MSLEMSLNSLNKKIHPHGVDFLLLSIFNSEEFMK